MELSLVIFPDEKKHNTAALLRSNSSNPVTFKMVESTCEHTVGLLEVFLSVESITFNATCFLAGRSSLVT
jgi:hypothetical protein